MKPKTRHLILLLLILIVIFVAIMLITRKGPLNGPESIVWDEIGKRFLISNTSGRNIVSMNLNGQYSPFLKKGLQQPRGITIFAKKLYVADKTNIKVIDLEKTAIIDTINIPGASMLNDLAFTKKGIIYTTDTAGNCVYVVDPLNNNIQKIVNPLLQKPNGIIYDMPRDQMFVVCFKDQSPILSISTLDNSVSIFMDSIYGELDGIAIDDLGRIYISSWAQDMIFEIPQEQNRFLATFKNIKDAADIYYYLPENELIVPLFSANKIIRLKLE
ncbi:MAG: SMP-30/gluconolactonase/LRE family protein [Candidatus Cloacimonas sp.]